LSSLLVIAFLSPAFLPKTTNTNDHVGQVLGATDWYDYDWGYRTAITIDNTKVDADLTDFPVLVSSTNANWADTSNGGYVEQSDGGDFVFTASDNLTVLPYEIEKYDNTTGQLIAWVEVNSLANASDTTINLYFGNAGCADQWDIAGTWANDFNNVWHFQDDPTGGTLTDALSHNNGTIVGSWDAADRVDAKIVKGLNFSGAADEEVEVGDIDSSISTSLTFSVWFKADVASGAYRIIEGNNANTGGVTIIIASNNLYYRLGTGGGIASKNFAFTDTTSYHLATLTWDGTNMHVYLDGAEQMPAIAAASYGNTTIHTLGGRTTPDSSQNWDGMIDQATFSNINRSAGWISTEYNNQNSPATFYSVAATEVGDSTAATNPTTIVGYNTSGKTVTLTDNSWASYSAPYFEFSGAGDDLSGLAGYYASFTTGSGDDPTVVGDYQAHVGIEGATQSYTSSTSLVAGSTYYLRVATKDVFGNTATAETLFTYKYDPTAPSTPEYVNISPVGCSTQTSFTFTWPEATDTGGSDISGYQYKRGSTGTINDLGDVLTATASSYQEGDNVFYVRSIDNAGNVSNWQTAVYCSTATVQVADGPSVETGPSSISVSWTSNKQTTGYVEVYEGNTYISEQGHTEYTLTHSVTVVGLKAEKTYRYRLLWSDSSGNLGESSWYQTTTAIAPAVKNLEVTTLSPNSISVSWSTTQEASCIIEYGQNDYDSSEFLSGYGTTFSKNFSSLTSGQTYQLRIKATTTSDSTEFFAARDFTTPPLPEISSVSYEIKDGGVPSATVSWHTNVQTTSSLFYGPKGGSKIEVASSEKLNDHTLSISSLPNSATYEFYVAGTDAYGNSTQSSVLSFSTPADRRPPTISDVATETSNVGLNKQDKAQIVVSWKTDEPSTSYVEYDKGLTGSDYTQKTGEDKTMTNSHLVIISDLVPNQPYHLRVVSSDAGGNQATSEDIAIIAGDVPKSIFNIITDTFTNVFGWLGKLI